MYKILLVDFYVLHRPYPLEQSFPRVSACTPFIKTNVSSATSSKLGIGQRTSVGKAFDWLLCFIITTHANYLIRTALKSVAFRYIRGGEIILLIVGYSSIEKAIKY